MKILKMWEGIRNNEFFVKLYAFFNLDVVKFIDQTLIFGFFYAGVLFLFLGLNMVGTVSVLDNSFFMLLWGVMIWLILGIVVLLLYRLKTFFQVSAVITTFCLLVQVGYGEPVIHYGLLSLKYFILVYMIIFLAKLFKEIFLAMNKGKVKKG